MTQKTYFVTFIGKIAVEALELHHAGVVKGLTSKGIFLQCGEYILFITNGPYKSPFNLYVPGFERLMKSLTTNSAFEVAPDAINFTNADVRILTENAEIWIPGPPASIETDQQRRITAVDSLLKQIVKIDPVKGWLFLYNPNPSLPADLAAQITKDTLIFNEGYKLANLETCLSAAGHLLGLGGGLTPSGDDWLAGFVLYQTRFLQASGKQEPFLVKLTDELLVLADQKTTTISVNRISAAGRGWAEEPFLQVIDALFTGAEIPAGLAAVLTHFGHSSGVDTTLGIAASVECE